MVSPIMATFRSTLREDVYKRQGLIRFTDPAGERHDAIWYRMGDKTYPLSHNRIRHIYEDKEQQLWIATDGSINRYDYATRQFIHYNIVDNTGTYNTCLLYTSRCV